MEIDEGFCPNAGDCNFLDACDWPYCPYQVWDFAKDLGNPPIPIVGMRYPIQPKEVVV